MARLAVYLLGSFQATLDGQPIASFESDKVRALLAYLAVESDRPHSREKLAGLLWPDRREGAARHNLTHVLTLLRHAIGDRDAQVPALLVSRPSIQFNRESDAFVDVVRFSDLSGLPDLTGLEQAVELYRGRFLEGFSLPGCPEFEEWLLMEQEHLHRLAMQALNRLAAAYEGEGNLQRAQTCVWRQLELDPWWENAHRQAMWLLVCSGQRNAALMQYQACCRLLAEELGVEPAPETVRLHEQIRDGQLPARPALAPELPEAPPALPGFLTGQASPVAPHPVFVGREEELAWLEGRLRAALDRHGQAAFVVGGAGRGKTVLLQEFARRAMDAHPDLLVAMGTCNAYTGFGDPYLPFRGVLAMLTGDVEAPWAAGTLSAGQALRMWDALPEVAPVLARWGSGLVGTLLPGRELLARARAAAAGAPHPALSQRAREETEWLPALERLADPRTNPPGKLEQSHLFDQFANVLLKLSAQHSLLLILDDLQWADLASVGLLFHLARHIERGRILLVGAYRPHELALGRDGERHPLEPALAEFRCRFGDAWLDLGAADEAGGRRFVDQFLDTEPNALDEGFRAALYGRTRGHPLFTVELLRAMQGRDDLVQDAAGRWAPGDRLDWEALPAQVEAAIAERVDRLPGEALREILAVASVEGEEFTAQVVALALGMDELQVLRLLHGQLAARHRLVREQGELRLDGRSLSRYRFSHFLVQQHLYQGLGEAERRLLHRRVGEALERLYEGRLDEVAVDLVRHFAGDPEPERRYARMAGERTAAQYANEEAVRYLSRALELTPGDQVRERYELLLTREKAHGLLARRDAQRKDLAELDLSAGALGTAEQAEVGVRRAAYCFAVADYHAAIAAAQMVVERAQTAGPAALPAVQAWGHYWLGVTQYYWDNYAEAVDQLREALELARRAGERYLEARVAGRLAHMQWWLQADAVAENLFRESLALAREAGDKATEARSARDLSWALCDQERYAEATELAEASEALCEQIGDRSEGAWVRLVFGRLAQCHGDWEPVMRDWSEAVTTHEADRLLVCAGLCLMGEASFIRGSLEEAWAYAERSRSVAEEIDSRDQTAGALLVLGAVAARQGWVLEACSYLQQAADLREEIGDSLRAAVCQAQLGYVLARRGRFEAAWIQLVRALRFSQSRHHPQQAKEAVCCIGQASVHAGCLQRGAELLGLASRLPPGWCHLEVRVEPEMALLREALGDGELEAALARGAALDPDQVVAEILACDTPEAYWGAGGAVDGRAPPQS